MRRTVKLKLRSELCAYFFRSKTEVRTEGIQISQVLLSLMLFLQRSELEFCYPCLNPYKLNSKEFPQRYSKSRERRYFFLCTDIFDKSPFFILYVYYAIRSSTVTIMKIDIPCVVLVHHTTVIKILN